MIYALGVFAILLIIFAMKRDFNSKPIDLNIGKKKDDIIEITMSDDILSLLKKEDKEYYGYHLRSFMNDRFKIDFRQKIVYHTNELDALIYDRLIVFFDSKFNLIFGYISHNFAYIEIGRIESDYVECTVGHVMHMRCDDSIGIIGILENEPAILRKNVFNSTVNFTSYGYSLTGLKNGNVSRGFLDNSLYYVNSKTKYTKIDHKCVEMDSE